MKAPDWKTWMKDKNDCKKWLDLYIAKGILRKSKDDSRLYLRKAEHNLGFANWIKERHKDSIKEFFNNETFYDWVVSIYYYSIYHSALALVSKQGFESKNHSATLCFLIWHNFYVRRNIAFEDVSLIANSLQKEDIESIGHAKEIRERASYNVHDSFEEKLAIQMQKNTIDFLNKIRRLLEKTK
jgi:uncharacterized protein (UPF0332 family)